MDIPFVFDTIDASQTIVGSGADRRGLADRMSGAWVAFARTGNPHHARLPKWEPFAAASRHTMMFGHECRLLTDLYREEASQSGRRCAIALQTDSRRDTTERRCSTAFGARWMPLLVSVHREQRGLRQGLGERNLIEGEILTVWTLSHHAVDSSVFF